MRIDRTHRPWIVWTLAAFVASAFFYAWQSASGAGGIRGGTGLGLGFGIAGYAAMLFVGLLGVRKKVPVWRVGRAQTWMRGHLWLGLISLPLILFHSAFVFRGPLTTVLMLLFFVVWVSGIFGAVLQHYLPRMMTTRVPMETIYEEIPSVREQLREEADKLVATLAVEAEHDDKVRFRETYERSVQPFLRQPETQTLDVGVFSVWRSATPAAFHQALNDLEDICEEEFQITRQRKFYHWLHGWLLVHVPLSVALLVLGGVHAVMALRY